MENTMMKKAHKMTREIVEKYKDVDYKTQLKLCIEYLKEENEKAVNNNNNNTEKNKTTRNTTPQKMIIVGTEKQIKWANDIKKETKKIRYILYKANKINGNENVDIINRKIYNSIENLIYAQRIINIFKEITFKRYNDLEKIKIFGEALKKIGINADDYINSALKTINDEYKMKNNKIHRMSYPLTYNLMYETLTTETTQKI